MARPALVVDASVGVKWFSDRGEGGLPQALAIRDGHVGGGTLIVVPELFFYEVANALVHKAHIPTEAVQRAARSLFDLGLEAVPMSGQLLSISVEFARDLGITVYDACYAALARERACPLVTANPRHQSRQVGMGCRVVLVEEWQGGA